MVGRRRLGFVRWLILVCGLALGIRVANVLLFEVPDLPLGFGDAAVYNLGANQLADGQGFIEPLNLGEERQSASHPPLYLLWLAIPSLLDPNHAATPTIHMLWSCVLGAGTVAVCGLLGRELAGERCGLIAAVLAALAPNLWVLDGTLLSETAAVFTTAVVLLLAYRFWRVPTAARAAWLGAWCSLAALSRPELLLTLPLVLLPAVLAVRGPALLTLRWLAAAGVSAALVLAPWVVFNLTRFEGMVVLSSNLGATLAAANCDATYTGDSIGSIDYNCLLRTGRDVDRPDMDQSQLDAALRREATTYIRMNSDRLPAVVLARLGRVTGLYRPGQEVAMDGLTLERESAVAISALVTYYVMAAFAVGGAVLLRRRRIPVLPLLGPVAIVLVSVAVTFGQSRYRAPADAALVVLAAVSVDTLLRGQVVGRHSTS